MIISAIEPALYQVPSQYNPTVAQRAETEARRKACLANASQQALYASHNEVESVKAWDAYAKRNRAAYGLGHLDDADNLQPVPKGSKLNHKPDVSPVEGVLFKVGVQDVVLKHGIVGQNRPNHSGGGVRGKITRFSRQSVDRLKLHVRNLPELSVKAFLTLTYPESYPTAGGRVKRDLKVMQQWLKRRGLGGVWFLEFQRRGAPHYHMFLNGWPAGGVDAVAHAWDKIVASGDPKHLAWHMGALSGRPCLELMRNPHAASAYATKYATKLEQKDVPSDYHQVGRFWGAFGSAMRPVWRWVWGSGSACAESTKELAVVFRSRFVDNERELQRWAQRSFVSCTMWGGSLELAALMSHVGWTPF